MDAQFIADRRVAPLESQVLGWDCDWRSRI